MSKKKTDDSEVRFLDTETLKFERTPGGVLSLRIGRKLYPRIHAYRAFPLSRGGSYLCIRDADDKEIGIVEDIESLPKEMSSLLLEELESRYFTPKMLQIVSLKEEYRYVYWDVETDAGRSRFTSRIGENSAIQLGGNRIIIVDVDGNRFELPDHTALEPKHQRIVELLL